MIEFPVSKKQGIARQSMATIAFSPDTQRRMRTEAENCPRVMSTPRRP